ncbi:MAG: FAD-binding oxidoreductase [Syntrophobacterales bacterium]|nr:MAG: FAD-binding oxidoreductase [Syntrophobacterales bacterium]
MEIADVVIIGGALMGSSIAYNLLNDGFNGKVLVLERDPTYEHSSTALSIGGIRQQFGTKVNIDIARYNVPFFEQFDELMEVDGERPHADFRQRGYLFFGRKEKWPVMKKLHEFQTSQGMEVRLLKPHEILEIIPHVNLEGVAGATFGPRAGYVDPHGVLNGFVKKAKSMGARYLTDEAVNISVKSNGVNGVKTRKGEWIQSPIVVNAAGPFARDVGVMAGIDIPVDPLRRMVYECKTPNEFNYEVPLTINTTGLYFRTETGGRILTGKSNEDEPIGVNFTWEKALFYDEIWPELAHRIPLFDRLRLQGGWAGLYAENRLDHNAILGEHPEVKGFYMAVGFSGHGLQQAPAVGKALSEAIRLGRYETVDVSCLGMARFEMEQLIIEEAVI